MHGPTELRWISQAGQHASSNACADASDERLGHHQGQPRARKSLRDEDMTADEDGEREVSKQVS